MDAGRRHELTDAVWAVLEPLLPVERRRRGRPWADHRRVINGILWVLATGVPWRVRRGRATGGTRGHPDRGVIARVKLVLRGSW